MEPSIASAFIKQGVEVRQHSVWADLGCGNGTFTFALAEILKESESTIFAVDNSSASLKALDTSKSNQQIIKLELDFISDDLPFKELDGIILANSLHFVRFKIPFLKKLQNHLKVDGSLLIVEYDTFESNAWVPFPVSFQNLCDLLHETGYHRAVKMYSYPSVYNRSPLYSAAVKGFRIQ